MIPPLLTSLVRTLLPVLVVGWALLTPGTQVPGFGDAALDELEINAAGLWVAGSSPLELATAECERALLFPAA